VGGIVRDIFAIGARPIAVLDSLRFGEPTGARPRYLLDGAVSGIAHYGNSICVPTVGGEVYFEAPYEHNCLINVMALGLARRERLVRSAAA
jgi:phosphoribosylformylglycinamidine synthase subunit PurL